MIIRNIIHKGLKRLVLYDDITGLQPATIGEVRWIMAFLQDMNDGGELKSVPTWKAHKLSSDRVGTWSLFVIKNWRLTCYIDKNEIEIVGLNYEDYYWIGHRA